MEALEVSFCTLLLKTQPDCIQTALEQLIGQCNVILMTTPNDVLSQVIAAMGLILGHSNPGCQLHATINLCRSLWLHVHKKSMAPKTAIQPAVTPSDAVADITIPLSSTTNIPVSTLALYAAVILSAFIDFRDLTIVEMLQLTAAAVRAQQQTAQYPIGCILNEVKTCVYLARIKALARISQYSFAQEEAVRLLPTMFVKNVTNPAFSLQSDNLLAVVYATPYLRERVLRLTTSTLLSLQMHSAVLEFCTLYKSSSASDTDAGESWLVSSSVWADIGLLVEWRRTLMLSRGRCQSPREPLLRYLSVSSPECGDSRDSDALVAAATASIAPLIKQIQKALTCFATSSSSSSGVDGGSQSIEAKDCDCLRTVWMAELRYRMGLAMFLAGGRLRLDKAAGCSVHLLESVRLDPLTGQGYTLLGHYYSCLLDISVNANEQNGVADRAMKCYMKGLGIDPLDVEAGWCLSEMLVLRNEMDRARKLWADIASLTAHAHWCLFLTAQHLLHIESHEDAAKSLQKCLELRPNDAMSWYYLGHCYASLSANVAADKALQRAVELAPRDVAVWSKLGDVRRKLCLLPQSLVCYDECIAIAAANATETTSSALIDAVVRKGQADTHLALAHQFLATGNTRQAARSLSVGIRCLETVVLDDSSGSGLWKRMGDLCCFASNLGPSDINEVFAPPAPAPAPVASSIRSIISGLGSDDYLPSHEPLLQLLLRGEQAHRKALSILLSEADAQQNDTIIAKCWFDIGSAVYRRAVVLMLSRGHLRVGDLKDDVRRLLLEAELAFHAGLELDPQQGDCLNGLGLVLYHSKASPTVAASHACFVRSAQLDPNASSFANIGMLLMRSGQESDELVRECFSALQLIEANPLIWAAQGNVFERRPSGFDKSAHDAYVAALEVSKPCDALLGSALTWLKMHASTLTRSSGIGHDAIMDHVNALRSEIRHEVEGPLLRFLHRRPVLPLGWLLLAWCLETRGALVQANEAIRTGVRALNIAAAGADKDSSLELESALLAFVRASARCKVKRSLQRDAATDTELAALPLLADCRHLETLIGTDRFMEVSSALSLAWSPEHLDRNKHLRPLGDSDADRHALLVRSWSLWIASERNPATAAASSSACLSHLSEAMNVALMLGSKPASAGSSAAGDVSFIMDFVRTCGALSERMKANPAIKASGFAPPAALLSTLVTALIVLDDVNSTSQPVNVLEMCAARSTTFAMALARSVLSADGKDGAIRLLRKFVTAWHPCSIELSVMLAELLLERAAESSNDLKEATDLLERAHQSAYQVFSCSSDEDSSDIHADDAADVIIHGAMVKGKDKDDWPSGVASNLLCRTTFLRLQVAQKRMCGMDEAKLFRDCQRSLHMFPSIQSHIHIAASIVV